ncbi:MAG TPA: ferritin [Solirubrobacteraceae bacterium]|nr:ferritin [Solirubrobacteraceae bacterium]
MEVPVPSERFAAALNEQVGREFAAAHQYVSIGTHYEDQTFPRLAHFFYEQAEEERGHAMKMVKYMLDTNCPVELGPIAAPTNHFESHIEPIKAALEQERKVTVHISELFEIARETKDYQSEQFIEWFLNEQVEEEATMQDLLQVAERTREIPMLLEEYVAREHGD